MNRFRINEIMETLLFPYCDTQLPVRDYLADKCLAYNGFLGLNLNNVAVLEEKRKKAGEYKEAEHRLIHYLAGRNRGRIKSYDDVVKLCDFYFPVLEIDRWMEEAQIIKGNRHYGSDKRENIGLFYMHNLRRIAESLLTYRDGVASIRTWNNKEGKSGEDIFYSQYKFDKVEVWNILCRFMVPDIFIVAFAIDSGLDETVLYEQKPNISLADKLLVKCLNKGMAENHLHFNAGFDYEMTWLRQVHLKQWYGKKQFEDQEQAMIYQAALFRCLAAGYLKAPIREGRFFLDWLRQQWKGAFYPCIQEMGKGRGWDRVPGIPLDFWEEWERGDVLEEQDYLLPGMYGGYIELKTSSEFLLLFHCCRYIRQMWWDTGFVSVFLQYLRIKNSFFQGCRQRFFLPGLRHFQEYFNYAKVRELRCAGPFGLALDVFRSQAKIVGLKKLEIRIAPDDMKELVDCFEYASSREPVREQLSRQLFDIFYVYRRYILEQVLGVGESRTLLFKERLDKTKGDFSYKSLAESIIREHKGLDQEYSIPTLGIVYHFIKMENLDNISGYYCWKTIGEERLKYSGHRLALRQRMANTARVIEEMRGSIPYLHEYIVGIDAASDENAMEPWMLSPAYNLMRARDNTRPVMRAAHNEAVKYDLVQNIGFTYHVGEDFRHIISGLRHIDEVIEELHYKPGDRLGHGLALGIDIGDWGADHEVIPIPLLEHMENLLWIWGKYVNEGMNLPIRMEGLEEKIMACAEQVYRFPDSITVRMLYKAYKRKFSVKHRELLEKLIREEARGMDSRGMDPKGMDGARGAVHCRYSSTECSLYGMPWTEDKLLSTYYCPVFEELYSKIILVSSTKSDLAVYGILQEELLKKVEQRGIYVETNPTSNLTIGEFADLRKHPIFRMSSREQPDKHHIMVTVNSDDPAVFNTNVENELAYIYYAAEYCGYAKEDILDWIDTIRENGMNASFIHRVKPVSALLGEIGEMLDWLDKDVLLAVF